MPDGGTALAQTLGELSALGSERDRDQLAALRDRLAEARLRVLVVGEAKRGEHPGQRAAGPCGAAVGGDAADGRDHHGAVRRGRTGRGQVPRRA
jgi:hypothetical protein